MEYFLCISCEPKGRIGKNPLEVESYEIPLAILQSKGGRIYPYGKTTGGAVRPSPSSFPVSHVQNSSNPSHCRAHSRVVNYMYG